MNRWQLKRAADSKAGTGSKKKNMLLDTALAVLALFLTVLLLTKAATGYATFFGYKPIYILTDSMEPVIPAGSWVVGVPACGEKIAVGDVAAYRRENGTKLQPTIIHRVVGITESGFIFQGDNNELSDSQIVRADQIILTSVKIFQFLHGTGCITGQPVPCRKENLIAREYIYRIIYPDVSQD